MASSLTISQCKLLDDIAEANGLLDYEIKENSTTAKGDNYLGQILCVTIKSRKKNMEVVVKKAPKDEKFRKTVPIRTIFLKEIYIYEHIFKTFMEFQNEYRLENPFVGIPKFHGKCEEEYSECFVMDNLKENGYSLWNRKQPMDAEHIALVLREYGRFHALSFAIKKKKPEIFSEIFNDYPKRFPEYDKGTRLAFLSSTGATLRKAVEGNSILEAVCEQMLEGIEKYLEELDKSDDKMVFTHGDCWCNNLLFKYENARSEKEPTKVCLLDWQIAKLALPTLDITYFFYTSSPKHILDNYKKYLRIYYDAFSENLKQMACDPEEVLSFKELESLWKKAAKYGMLLVGFIFKVLYMDTDDAPEVFKNTTSMDSFFTQFDVSGYEKQVNERILDVFNYALDNDLL